MKDTFVPSDVHFFNCIWGQSRIPKPSPRFESPHTEWLQLIASTPVEPGGLVHMLLHLSIHLKHL